MSGPDPFPEDLLRVFAGLRDPAAIALVLEDLLTPAEIRSIRERWAIIQQLAAGRTQREVRDEVGVAIATVSRGAQQLRYGRGGFALALEALERETEAAQDALEAREGHA